MSVEGHLDIRIHGFDRRVPQVSIASTRIPHVSRIFEGKSVEEALAGLPRVYGICRHAQSLAAVEAAEMALRIGVDPVVSDLRHFLVRLETAREHLWRIALDWPRFNGGAPDTSLAAAARRVFEPGRETNVGMDVFRPGAPAAGFSARSIPDAAINLLESAVFGRSLEGWRRIEDRVGLEAWAFSATTPAARVVRTVMETGLSDAGRSDVAVLPPLGGVALGAQLRDGVAVDFLARPTWGGVPRETSVFARRQGDPLVRHLMRDDGNGLLPRVVARLVELAQLPLEGDRRDDPVPVAEYGSALPPSEGLARVEAARGTLLHRMVLAKGRVERFQILAPTEWNFHPRGAVAQGLRELACRLEDRDALLRTGTLFVGAVDPCVAFRFELCDPPLQEPSG